VEIEDLQRVVDRMEGEIAMLKSDHMRLEHSLDELQKKTATLTGAEEGPDASADKLLGRLGGMQALSEALSTPEAAEALSKVLGGRVGDLLPLLTTVDTTAKSETNDENDSEVLKALANLSPEMSRAIKKLNTILPLVTAVQNRRVRHVRHDMDEPFDVVAPHRVLHRTFGDDTHGFQEYEAWSVFRRA
jgi:hypothetical protein